MAVEIANESSDLFLPLKAVVGALAVFVKNYDVCLLNCFVPLTANGFLRQTITNAEQIRDIEERVQSRAEVLASPVSGQDSREKARRRALRKLVLYQGVTAARY